MEKDRSRKGRKRVVVIGGGTGVFTVLRGLRKTGHHLSAIVTMADDGGSSGVLREEFGILPPGDIRRALVALSHAPKILAELFAYRFEEGRGLSGHSVGNLLITALERMTGSFEGAIAAAGEILRIDGDVIPVTLDHVRLKAWLEGGGVVVGEHAIDVPRRRRIARIVRIALTPRASPNPHALEVIDRAHLVVIGPGDLYTSVLPNLIVEGIADRLRRSRAKKVYVVNLMTKRGETDGFTAKEFVGAIEDILGEGVLDAIVVNTAKPSPALIRRYREESGSQPVAFTPEMFDRASFAVVRGSFLRREGMFIRHDPEKLARTLIRFL